MAWYKTGSIKATQNSNVVTGTGTDWKNNLYGIGEGQALVFGNNRVEIAYVVSNTELRLAEPYKGATYNGNYHIENMFAGGAGDYVRQISAAIRRFAEWGLDLNEWFTSKSDFIQIKDPVGNIVEVPTMNAQLKKGDFGVGSNAIYDGSTPSAQSPKDANDIASTGFYGGGGSSALNYFNNYYPILSMTRTGGDGTGYITQIQGSDGKLGFRHRVQNNWTDWYQPVILNHKGLQKLDGSIVAQNHRIGANPLSATRDGNDYLSIYPPKVGDGKDVGFFQYNFGNAWNGVLRIPRVPAGKTRELAVIEENNILVYGSQHWAGLRLYKASGEYAMLETNSSDNEILSLAYRDSKGSNVSVLRFPRQDGQVMVQGDYGFAGNGISEGLDESKLTAKVFDSKHSQIFRSSSNPGKFGTIYSPILFLTTGDTWATISTSYLTGNVTVASSNRNKSNPIQFNNLWGTSNTTTDSNGFIKKASPIIKIYGDGKFVLNDESEGAKVNKIGVGHYRVLNTEGFHSDRAWGVDGGLSVPKDHNDNPLIWVEPEVNADGSIDIYTFHRENYIPDNIRKMRERRLNKMGGVYASKIDGEPCDIPEGAFIDVRVEMPYNSIYNVKTRANERVSALENLIRVQQEILNNKTLQLPLL